MKLSDTPFKHAQVTDKRLLALGMRLVEVMASRGFVKSYIFISKDLSISATASSLKNSNPAKGHAPTPTIFGVHRLGVSLGYSISRIDGTYDTGTPSLLAILCIEPLSPTELLLE